MIKMCTRLGVLFLMIAAAFFATGPNKVAAFDCVSVTAMFDEMSACDDAYWYGAAPYHDVINNNPNYCDYSANNVAWLQCFGDPNFSTCYAAAYAQEYNDCVAQATTSYQSAGSTYSSCLWDANNPGCFETLEFCPLARDRAAQCEALANEPTYSECLNASGVWQCQ